MKNKTMQDIVLHSLFNYLFTRRGNTVMIPEMVKEKKKRPTYTFDLEPALREKLEEEANKFSPPTTLATYIRYLIESHPIRQPKKK